MTDRILLDANADIAEVRLNRPEKMGATSPAMFETLVTVGKRLINETDLRAVVLFEEGHAFCAGPDMGSIAGLDSNDVGSNISAGCLAKRTHGAVNLPQCACMVWRNLPVLVLAAVYGIAYGDNLQIVLGADVRYIAADTCLSVIEIKQGLVPDMGGMALTRGLVRPDRLRRLIYSGYVVDGEEAFALGLTTHVVDDPRVAALAAARDAALKDPDATRAGKRLMRVAEDGDAAAILLAESIEQDRLISTDNQHGAILAGMQDRTSVF